MEQHIISQTELRQLTTAQLVEKIKTISTTTIKELRYSDLYQPQNSCHGIYFVASPEGKYYFGKAAKRCIADRIGAHFDSRKDGFLNSLLKNIAQSDNAEALHQCYNNIQDWHFGVLFVEGKEDEPLYKLIELAERVLIFTYRQADKCFNGCNRRQGYPDCTLEEILR